ncbi:hypothetical protein NEUTE2DRAFT_57633 [Neurospora tetrasperma FGSC 2509]|nr:hypothetical protein NEUTE2DRAFT_57633 [Neurospora tetrasperma FGSC 2509]
MHRNNPDRLCIGHWSFTVTPLIVSVAFERDFGICNDPFPAAVSPSSHLSRAPFSPLQAPLPAAAAAAAAATTNPSSFFPPPFSPFFLLPAYSLRKRPRQNDEEEDDNEEEEQQPVDVLEES